MAVVISASRLLLPIRHSRLLLSTCPPAACAVSTADTSSKFGHAFLAPKFITSFNQKQQHRSRTFATMASQAKEIPANNPGLNDKPDEATKGYFLQQTMLRVKDPKISLDFYSRVLGMKLLKRLDFPDMKFSLYFLGYEDTDAAPADPAERTVWTFQKVVIELTHNWGTESDPDFKGYHNGNSEPRGFGHFGITVDDTYKACERFAKLGVEFVKKPDDGKMKGLAFIKDPDGYWIEIFDLKRIGQITSSAA